MAKNLPGHVGDMGSTSDSGRSHMPQSKVARAAQLLSLCSRAGELHLLKPTAPRPRAPQGGKSPR